MVEIRNETGAMTQNLLHQIRQDGDGRWLFIAHGKEPYNKDISKFQDLRITIPGQWRATIYDTLSGETKDVRHCINNNHTDIYERIYDYDSLLLWLEQINADDAPAVSSQMLTSEKSTAIDSTKEHLIPITVPYTLSEPNVLLLDQAEYALDGGAWIKGTNGQATEEILRLDDECRRLLGWPSRKSNFAQPWVVPEEPTTHTVHLRWHISSDIYCEGIQLAMEDSEQVTIRWNEEPVDNILTGWYVDKSIKTIALPPLQIGDNILEADIPFGKRTGVEWAYLLGNFGVEAIGKYTRIVAAKKEISLGDITKHGLPFYGGNIPHHVPLHTEGGSLTVRSSRYKGAMQSIRLDNNREIPLIYPPYTATIEHPETGNHTLDITLYGHRRNSFGPIHLSDLKETWIGPPAWRSVGESWCYDYMICEEGILSTPQIKENILS